MASFDEFTKAFATSFEPPSEDELVLAFKAFDKSGDGFISCEELKEGLKPNGQTYTDNDIDAIIFSVDKDGNDQVNYEE